MRKVTLVFLIMSYLSSFTELHELLKVANLFTHYIEHREQDETLSFTDFLSLHYGSHSEHGKSSEHEEQLPFKADHLSIAWINLIAPISTSVYNQEFSYFAEAFDPVAFYRSLVASSPESSIWQPPRLVA